MPPPEIPTAALAQAVAELVIGWRSRSDGLREARERADLEPVAEGMGWLARAYRWGGTSLEAFVQAEPRESAEVAPSVERLLEAARALLSTTDVHAAPVAHAELDRAVRDAIADARLQAFVRTHRPPPDA